MWWRFGLFFWHVRLHYCTVLCSFPLGSESHLDFLTAYLITDMVVRLGFKSFVTYTSTAVWYVHKGMYLSHQVCVLMSWLFFPCSSSHITEFSNNIATNTDGIILWWITTKTDLAYWSMIKLNWRREKGRLSTALIVQAGAKGNIYIDLWIGTLPVEEKHALV